MVNRKAYTNLRLTVWFLRQKITMAASCLEIRGSHPLKSKEGWFKSMVVSVWRIKNSSKANKEQAKKNPQSCAALLLKMMTEIDDGFLPQQKGAQLESWRQQALCTSTLCFAYSITHWRGDKNKQDNTLSNPGGGSGGKSWSHSFLGVYLHTVYLQIEVLKKIVHAIVRN